MLDTYKMLNKGIPSSKGISIDIELLCNECCNNPKEAKIHFRDLFIQLIEEINEKFKFPYIGTTYSITFTLDDELRSYLVFEPNFIHIEVLELLGIPLDKFDGDILNPEIKKEIINKIDRIKSLRLEKDLEKEFPEIYIQYQRLVKFKKDYDILNYNHNKIINLRKIPEFHFNNDIDSEEKKLIEGKKQIEKYFDLFGINRRDFNFRKFIESTFKLFNRLYRRNELFDIMEYIFNYEIDLNKLDGNLDPKRFELFLAISHLSAAKYLEYYKVQNISYVTNYLKENKDNLNDEISILLPDTTIDELIKEKNITPRKVYELYQEYLLEHPEIKISYEQREDFIGSSEKEIEEYVDSYSSELEVSWELLGELSEDGQYERTNSNNSVKQSIENLERIFDEKQQFFEDNKPYLVIRGKNAFDGYIGYIYSNAKIVLERFYDNKGKTRLSSSAIYVMDVDEFIELSQKSKTEIIKNDLCKRITHHKGWEEKALKVVRSRASLDTVQEVQIFANQIRRLK